MGKLLVVGCINWDVNFFLSRFPQIGEEVTVTKITRVPGGTAANVSVAASRLMNRREVALIGGVGDDEIGKTQLSILDTEGVNTSGIQVIPSTESGQAYITIDARGQNCIYTYLGANRCVLPHLLRDPKVMKLIKAAEVIVIMDPPLSTAAKVAEIGRTSGALIVWDPGVYCEQGIDALSSTLAVIDYFILNQIEFSSLLNAQEPHQIGNTLSKINEGLTVIMKRGAAGCTLIKEQGRTVISIPSVNLNAIGMRAVNTVGCGDAFIGAFASAKVQGLGDKASVIRANYAGAFKATQEDTRGSPTHAELEAFIERSHSRDENS